MVAAKTRLQARESLTGKWGKAALMMLSFLAIELLISIFTGFFVVIPFLSFLVSIVFLVLSFPLFYGLLVSFIKLKRNETVNYTDFLSIMVSNIANVWKVLGHTILKMLPLVIVTLLLAILAPFGLIYSNPIFSILIFLAYLVCVFYLIPKSLLYVLSFLVLYDHPEMTAKEVVEKSESLMMGNRWNLFWLYLTFFGWIILSAFTFGIGYLFLIPYICISFIVFYENLDGTKVASSKELENGNTQQL